MILAPSYTCPNVGTGHHQSKESIKSGILRAAVELPTYSSTFTPHSFSALKKVSLGLTQTNITFWIYRHSFAKVVKVLFILHLWWNWHGLFWIFAGLRVTVVLAQLFNEVDFTKITTILKNILKICILDFSSSSKEYVSRLWWPVIPYFWLGILAE